MLDDAALRSIAGRLVAVPGVVAVSLGGSRARGDHAPDSDVDLGLHYRPPLDVDALRALARDLAGPAAEVTAPGGWGPWVDGGGWLTIAGTPVDWIYRDLDRVRASCDDAVAGRVVWHAQTGHPLGVPSFAYAGEAALGVVLADPSGELGRLRALVAEYPPALRSALVEGLGEGDFLLGSARKGASRADAAWVAGCLFRVVLLCAHALHAAAGRWVVNEKGAVASAGRLPLAPPRFAERAHAVVATAGTAPERLQQALGEGAQLVDETRAGCG